MDPPDHGRIEIRKILTTTELNDYLNFPHVGQAFVIQREFTDKKTGKYSCEIAYGITSRPPEQADPKRVLATNRGHWNIENCCPYIIDWNYHEDRSRIRTGHGPKNITRLRRFAIGIIKSKRVRSVSQKMRQLSFNVRLVFDFLRMTENSCAGALRNNYNKFTVVRPPKKIDNFGKERYASMMFAFRGDAAITYRYVICLLIFLSYVLVFFHRLCPAVIALDIQSSFGISGTLLGVLGSAYFYSYAIMQLPTGLMADSWGPRKTVSVFLLLAGVGSIVMGIAPSLAVAVTGRILVGIGVSTVFVCNFKLLSEWFTPRQFIIMGSAFMSMGGIGALFSSAPLAWVSNAIGWRMTFLFVGIITLLMAALVYVFVRNRPSEMGLSPITPNREETQKGIGLLSGMKMVVTSGRFWPPAIWAFCVIGISFSIGGLWGGPYLMQIYGHSKTSAGGVLSTFALALIFGSPISGWFANRIGRKSVLIGASVMLMMVSGIMGLYVDSMTLPALYVLFFFLFFSGGAIGPVIATVAKELFPITISGTAVGAINLFPFAGAALFQVLIGAVLTARSLGQAQYTAVGFRYMFLICLAGGIVSLVAAFMMKETLQYREGS